VAEIVLDHVTKRFPDGTVAVDDANLDIADGEFAILVGPSGSGKSTLLNMIAGLEDITEGEIHIGGRVVNQLAPKDRDIAMVFQDYALYPHMTVRENMAFSLKLAHVDRAEMDRKVKQAAELLELTELLDRKPANLSGGQRQRVAMGRAIVRSPQAFLMDEPLSNLDAKLRVQTRTTIARLQNQLGTTTVYVTHDQTEAMTLGDRVAVLRSGGVIQQVDTPQELYQRPRNLFVAGFIGSPSMNFLPSTLEDGQLRTPLGDLTLPAEIRAKVERSGAGRDLIMGIRPENFEDAALVAADQKAQGLTFSAVVDVLESLGADEYAYFRLQGARATAQELEELAADAGAADIPGAGEQIVARLDPASRAREGQKLELWFDPRKLHLFNPSNGTHLTL
jgi:multiple sugar transport system ATP-binding protein